MANPHLGVDPSLPSTAGSPEPSTCPRVLRDVVLLPVEDGVIIDGFARREIMRGPIAQTVLPALLDLMDGTRTLDDLAAAFPEVPAGYVRSAVSLLEDWGLLERAADRASPPGEDSEVAAFLRRRIGPAHLADSASGALARLAGANVVLAAAGALRRPAELLQNLLVQSGIGSVRVAGLDLGGLHSIPSGMPVAVLSGADEEAALFQELDRRAIGGELAWLRVVFDQPSGWADIGPLFRPGTGTCYACFRAMHACSGGPPGPPPEPETEHFWLSLAALEIVHQAALPELALSGRNFRRFLLPHWRPRNLTYARRPGCPHCWSTHADTGFIDTAVVFEQCVGLETRRPIAAATAATEAGPEEIKKLPNSEQIPLGPQTFHLGLPVLDAFRARAPGTKNPIQLAQLAALLALTGGVRELSGRKVQRWAANAGNLGSVELFVAVRSVDGLPPGIYFYGAGQHTLAVFRKRRAPDPDDFIRRVLGCSDREMPGALVLLTGAFHRLERKYGAFGQRLVLLDAGCALGQLHLAAQALQLSSRTAAIWADDLIERELNLRGPGEQVTAVVELAPSCAPRNPPPASSSFRTPSEFQGLTAREVGEMLFRESRMPESHLALASSGTRQPIPAAGRPTVRLPKPLRGHLSVGEVLAGRRSVRTFSGREAPLSSLATMLYLASSADAADWPAERDQPLQFVLLAQSVSGVQPGVYAYDATSHGLLYLRSAIPRHLWNDLFVQNDWADAAFVIWVVGDLAAACARYGSWGQRQLLLRAGAACHRLWMPALALGLDGALVAGFVPGAARTLLGFDGYERASLFAFAGGFRPES